MFFDILFWVLKKGMVKLKIQIEIEPITFGELAEKWYNCEIIDYAYQYSKEIKSSINHLNCAFKNTQVTEIKFEDVKEFIARRYKYNPNTGRIMSKSLISNIIDIGSRIFEFGIDNDYAYRNPFHNKKRLIPKNATNRIREPISDTQIEYIISTQHRAQNLSIIMLFCGLRLGEALCLNWQDIDFSSKQISVIKSLERINTNAFQIKPHTKNKKDRYVPIPDKICDYLYKQRTEVVGNGLICSQLNGKLHTLTSYQQMWNSYQTELNFHYYCDYQKKLGKNCISKFSPNGFPHMLPRFTAHQLRHTYCTMLYFAGVDVLTASKLMGHSSVDITLRIYTHLDEKFKQYNISKFNEYVKNLPITF